MATLTTYGEQYAIDALLAKLTADGKTLYAQLTTTAPSKASAGTAFGSRVSMAVTRTSDTLANSAELDFGNAGSAASLVGIEVYDAASNGNRIIYGTLTGQPVAVESGQPVRIAAGAFAWSPDANV